jgi:hypothetical protein
MALGQADQLGNTLLQNRMMKQQQAERGEDRAMRERMFNENVTARKEATTANNEWRTQNEDQQQLQTIIKANAEGSLDDAGRAKANQWIATHPKLSGTGIQLIKPIPKQPGQFNTAPGRNLEILTQLRQAVAQATTPEEKATASQQLNDFMSFTGKPAKPEIDPRLSAAKKAAIDAELSGDAGAMERAQKIINQVTPKETVPVMGDVRKRDEELMGGDMTVATPEKVADYNTELKLANEAITAKVPFAKVAARFKARTGKDFPKP